MSARVELFQPLPAPDYDTQPFWDGCREHRLMLQRCTGCGAVRHPPSPVCPRCRTWSDDWREQSGRGVLETWVVVHHAIPPQMAAETPYVTGLVRLGDEAKIPARIVGADPDDLVEGMEVEVRFRDVTEEISVPDFAPVRDGERSRDTRGETR